MISHCEYSEPCGASWQEEASLIQKLHKTQYGGLPPHSTGIEGAFARAMGRHDV